MGEAEQNMSSRNKRNNIKCLSIKKKKKKPLCVFQMDNARCQITIVFLSHWIHLKE